jgi:hypothetical protein
MNRKYNVIPPQQNMFGPPDTYPDGPNMDRWNDCHLAVAAVFAARVQDRDRREPASNRELARLGHDGQVLNRLEHRGASLIIRKRRACRKGQTRAQNCRYQKLPHRIYLLSGAVPLRLASVQKARQTEPLIHRSTNNR